MCSNRSQTIMSVDNELILKVFRIVINHELSAWLSIVSYVGHSGLVKTLRRDRDIVFLPGLTKDITDLILIWNICLEFRNSNPNESLQTHKVPSYTWQAIALDLYLWDCKNDVLFVDYYSKFFEVFSVTDAHSSSIILKCMEVFACKTWYTWKVYFRQWSTIFKLWKIIKFSKQWNVQLITSIPRYPRSNDLAERTVQTIKGALNTCKTGGQDISLSDIQDYPIRHSFTSSQLL